MTDDDDDDDVYNAMNGLSMPVVEHSYVPGDKVVLRCSFIRKTGLKELKGKIGIVSVTGFSFIGVQFFDKKGDYIQYSFNQRDLREAKPSPSSPTPTEQVGTGHNPNDDVEELLNDSLGG